MKYSGLVQQVGLFTILMVILLDLLGLFGPIDSDVRDLQQQHVGRSPSPMSPDIVHVDIDDGALQRIGRWPWPRPLLAACIDELRDAGARTIAIDLELSEPGLDPAADRILADAIQSDTVLAMLHQDDGLRNRWLESGGTTEGLNTLRELLIQDIDLEPDRATTLESSDREAFAENELAIKREVLWSHPSLAPRGIAERSIQDAYTQQAESERIAVERGLLDRSNRSRGSSMDRLPIPTLLEQAGAVGYVHISRRDSDGSVRSIQPIQTGRSGAATSLGAAAALHFMGRETTHGGSFEQIDGELLIGGDIRLPLVDDALPLAWPFTPHGTGWTHLLRQDVGDPIGSGHLSIGTIAELVRGRELQAENLETMTTLSLDLLRFLRQDAELEVENPLSDAVQSEIADEYEFTLEGIPADSQLEMVFDDEDALAHARALRAWKLLSDSIDDGRIEIDELDAALRRLVDDRLVFLGWTATGSIADFVPTVAGARTPGVVVHAATANMILTGHAYGHANSWSVVLILLLGIIVVGLVGSTSPLVATVCSLFVVAMYVLIAAVLTFSWLDLFVPVAAPATGGLATWIACTSTSAILIQ
ncbi:MAG: CHASE2 domain-containing protein, partial [Phycisphaerales bacterium]|nr:CHASE2 domain-containing protein [Phycisphaerales bacterium]